MKVENIKIDSTIVKFYDDYIEEDTTIFIDILATTVKKILINRDVFL